MPSAVQPARAAPGRSPAPNGTADRNRGGGRDSERNHISDRRGIQRDGVRRETHRVQRAGERRRRVEHPNLETDGEGGRKTETQQPADARWKSPDMVKAAGSRRFTATSSTTAR